MSRRGSLAAAAGMIAGITLLARIVGFGRWLAFSHSVGATCVGQVYNTANLLPNVLYEVAAGGALAAVAVPLVARALVTDRADADRIASALLTWAIAFLLPLAVLLALFAGPIASWMLGTNDCGDSAVSLAATFVRIFAPQVVLYGIGVVAGGVLQAHQRFVAAALAPLLSSLVVIASYLLFGRIGTGDPATITPAAVAVLAGGTTLGVCALSLPLLAVAARAGIRLRPRSDFPPGVASSARRLAGAGIAALIAQQLAVLITAWVTNHRGGPGALTVYNYVQALYLLPYAVLAVPVATAAFPRLATGTPGTLSRSAAVVAVAGAASAALLIAVAPAAGRFFGALDAGRGGNGAGALDGLSPSLTAFAPGVLGFGLTALLLRAAYARHITGGAAAAMCLGWAIAGLGPFVTLNARTDSSTVLVRLGIFSTVGMSIAAVALAALLLRGGTGWSRLPWRTLAAGLVAAVAGALCGRWCAQVLDGGSLVAAAVSAVLAALVATVVFAGVLALLDRATFERLVVHRGRA